MPFWTRLRPGKYPAYNVALCNFPRRAFDLRLSRQIALLLRSAERPAAIMEHIICKANKQSWWERGAPNAHEPPF